ncbi:PLP-dependent aminotransferase family protein [Pectobacterium brasiliense]|uniref:MocR-like pyridoxine biosynthesis transcription factor PdxR n=1 Tax=Pectobacterium TaxID=122277 RepID=UPI001968C553|nr:PLP-dependent aminotransferase family protein [Pectobacterium brasiliense]MBN3042887.1 PLP-dependent aminotransferase family protein [Pectobacterium brasiliense]
MDMQQLKPSREHDAPLYLQLYRRYRDAITAGKLHPGDRVPSVRSLASELNLARGTVEMAYQMLASEGYFLTLGPAGTIVSPRLENLGESGHIATSLSQIPTRPQTEADQVQPFQLGLPALDAFPRKTWARLAGHNLRTLDAAAMIYPDPAGYEPLRRAIATYLGISRGITCTYEQVFITAGYRGALELVCRTLLQPGDSGWFEDPGYLFARQFLERAGMHLQPVPVDEEGLNVDMGQQRAAEARFAVVTPTHQSPMGVALSLPRRLQLLEWASHRRSWIIEDDYDSEFRYHGRPLPALKSLDRDGRVLYTGTFSKVLFPGLRLAYLVVPEPQIERFKDTANHFCCPGSILPQATVAAFMEQGHFARHLRRMRSLYAIRRGYLVDALLQTLGSHLVVQPQAGGIHVLAKLAARGNDKSLAAAAQSHGLAIQALNDWRISSSSHGGLLMGFTNVAEPAMAKALVHRLAVAIGLS